MKKILCVLISLALVMLVCIPAFAQNDDLVVDNADILTDSEEQQLEEELREISHRLEFDVVVLTVYGLEGKTATEYADDYYDYNDYGWTSDRDGCLLIVDMDSRFYTISTCGYGITALTDYGLEVIYDEILDGIADGQYLSAFEHYGLLVDEFVKNAINGSPYDQGNNYGKYDDDYFDYSDWDDSYTYKPNYVKGAVVSLLIGAVIALIVTLTVKSKYKPVQFNRSAANYLDNGSLKISQSYENFLYNHVTAVKIQSESSSGGHSGGSSTHTSSSGMSHGGGGGRSF